MSLNSAWQVRVRRYGVPCLAVAAAILMRWILKALGNNYAFITFFPAVVVSAVIGGGRAGALATVLSALCVAYWILPPAGLAVHGVGQIVALSFFCIAGFLISIMARMLGKAHERIAVAVERGRSARERDLAIEFLALVNKCRGTSRLIDAAVNFFRLKFGCEAVAIRLRDGGDYPYAKTAGFSREFVLAENSLQATGPGAADAGPADLECMCGDVIAARLDTSKPFFTPTGSFWTNDLSRLLAREDGDPEEAAGRAGARTETAAAMERPRVLSRRRCHAEGYESVALIALRSGEERLGVLQLNDRRRGLFTVETMALLERLAGHLGVALAKARAEEMLERSEGALKRANEDLEQRVGLRTEELRAAHALLQENTRYLEAFFEHDINPLVFLDREFRFIRVNEAYARACARPVSEFPGRNHFDFYPHPENQAIFERVVKTRTPYVAVAKPFEYPDHPEWGVTYWNWTLVPVLDAAREVDFLVLSLEDVTARKRAEIELMEYNLRLEQTVRERTSELLAAAKAKDQFIASLSHELRTPLTPALAAASILRNDPALPRRARDDLGMIERNIGLEVRLIHDLLDVSRIVSGKVHLEKRPVDVAGTIREAASIVSGEIQAKRQTLALDLPGAPYFMPADEARLQQVFWNLLRNACKFTLEGGRISVRASLSAGRRCPLVAESCPLELGECPHAGPVDGEAPYRNLRIEVADTGRGIAPDLLPRLFNPFEQGSEARAFGGLGLGLSICKAVVESHGGTISARSEGPGLGSVFEIDFAVADCPLPAAHADSGSSVPVAGHKPDGRRLRILLVEDHADTAEMLQRLLIVDGCEVTVAGSVRAGLEAVERNGAFDLIISDLGLPDGSGHDLMRYMRERGRAIPGIALSGYGSASDIEESRESGFREHLVKPIDLAALAQALQRARESR